MQSSIFLCLSQAMINWEGCGRKGIRRKMGHVGGGSLTNLEGVAPNWTVGVSASVIFPCTKSRTIGHHPVGGLINAESLEISGRCLER